MAGYYDDYEYNYNRPPLPTQRTRKTLSNFGSGYGSEPRERTVKATVTVERAGLRLSDEDWIGIRGEEMHLRMRRNMLRVNIQQDRQAQIIREQGEAALLDAVLRWAQSNATDFYYITDDATIAFLSDSDAVAFKMQFHGEVELKVIEYY